MPSRYDLTRDDLATLLAGEPAYRVGQAWAGLHRRGVGPEAMTDLPAALRHRLAGEPAFAPGLRVLHAVGDGGGAHKWVFEVAGGARVEAVLLTHHDRSTVCISSQAGCAMACGFCATGQAGFERNLTVGEMVEQVVVAAAAARAGGRRLSRVVLMGMGEPLANYERVWAAIERIHDDLGLAARHLTVSTVGLVPGIHRLAGERLGVNLAVSLHAADDERRDRLVPINRRYPLADLVEACRHWRAATGRRLSFEWALIAGVNDRPTDAARLAALARDLGAHVNLIPL
ncbi:MAG: 23S rRNA (adenine(2503)-C(2))-methyltransferase RlmN, partial [Acidimicrobiales bacterium]